MDLIILLGAIVCAVGLAVKMINAKWSSKSSGYYLSKNRMVSLIEGVIMIIGLLIILIKA
ncbi:hypothetical protein [Vagococcus humatus]|uniref:Uncharacterized protein n=1 Tax=Vagococcus humatus TaxID=1889241 RepID=A0A3R9YCY3_9ENTE|nr:hypothetical protein [Vagococcus humatus]RST89496.1 hypothetical protein C7P63_06930 [Vagococcus humatus]